MPNQEPENRPETVALMRAVMIAALLDKRLLVYAHKLLGAHPACRLSVDQARAAGSDAVLEALLDLQPAVAGVLSRKILETVGYMVAATAINEAVDADLRNRTQRKPEDTLSTMRADGVMTVTMSRMAVGANILLEQYPGCRLPIEAIYAVADVAVHDALLRLPPAIVNVASDQALWVISFFVGWTAMHDAIDTDLRRRFTSRSNG